MTNSRGKSKAVARLPTAEERDEAVRVLSQAFADDAIAVDEFEQRVASVYKAETSKALKAVTADLPAAPKNTEGNAPLPAPIDSSTTLARRPSQQLTSVLSSLERRIQGPMPDRLDVRSVMGSLELDLRRADFPPGVTEIRLNAVMANIEMELPDHVRVEDDGHAFLTSFSIRGRSHRRERGEEVIVRITGRSILSNVEVELDD